MPAAPAGGRTSKPPFVPEAQLNLSRVFSAPRDIVFRAWTDPHHLAQWWGPRGCSTVIDEMDIRPGGAWRYAMHAPDGNVYRFDGVYIEIAEPERLVFDGFIHGSPAQRVWTEVTFRERAGQTEVNVCQYYTFVSDATRGASIGWNQQLDRFAEFLRETV
jgi:uncharacterized protein YndB with AHSA1/START domain